MNAVIYIFVLDRQRGGGGVGEPDVFVWVFLKGHALIHSRKWKGHDFFRKRILKCPGPPPPIKNVPSFKIEKSSMIVVDFAVDVSTR